MRFLGLSLFAVLTVIAGLHVYWGFGGLWPASSERELIDMVIGDPRAVRMPAAGATMMVAAMIFASGLVALARTAPLTGIAKLIALSGCGVLALVFLARGLFTYLVAFGVLAWPYPLTDRFAELDRALYAPLCLAIALGFIALGAVPPPRR